MFAENSLLMDEAVDDLYQECNDDGHLHVAWTYSSVFVDFIKAVLKEWPII